MDRREDLTQKVFNPSGNWPENFRLQQSDLCDMGGTLGKRGIVGVGWAVHTYRNNLSLAQLFGIYNVLFIRNSIDHLSGWL